MADVTDFWDTFADEYTRACTPFSVLHAFDLLTAILPSITSNPQSCTILDVGCGGAALALAYLRHFPQGVEGHTFICTDFSPAMVNLARAAVHRVKPETCKTVFQFRVDNGTTLQTVEDKSVDVVVSAFAVFLIPDQTQVLTQINRVLRDGGVFGMTAWTQAPETLGFGLDFEEIIFGRAKFFQPTLEDLPSPKLGGPEAAWRNAENGKEILSNANFQNVRSWKAVHSASFRDMMNVWSIIMSSPSPERVGLSKEDIDKALQSFRATVITKSGMKKVDEEDQEHMIFLVGASNIFVGRSIN